MNNICLDLPDEPDKPVFNSAFDDLLKSIPGAHRVRISREEGNTVKGEMNRSYHSVEFDSDTGEVCYQSSLPSDHSDDDEHESPEAPVDSEVRIIDVESGD